ncbi:hypothetical protein CC78DRAFT_581523 [Lojkania enalia]|uniref:Uncharacterized protein n=1 Tax=Lojkania enalia TaxID=147567 RepID=A0A9P4K7D3_9PLEO|nr:hypothetical protein CC78DRAFT_581523 [Didymosphaeria enalia]
MRPQLRTVTGPASNDAEAAKGPRWLHFPPPPAHNFSSTGRVLRVASPSALLVLVSAGWLLARRQAMTERCLPPVPHARTPLYTSSARTAAAYASGLFSLLLSGVQLLRRRRCWLRPDQGVLPGDFPYSSDACSLPTANPLPGSRFRPSPFSRHQRLVTASVRSASRTQGSAKWHAQQEPRPMPPLPEAAFRRRRRATFCATDETRAVKAMTMVHLAPVLLTRSSRAQGTARCFTTHYVAVPRGTAVCLLLKLRMPASRLPLSHHIGRLHHRMESESLPKHAFPIPIPRDHLTRWLAAALGWKDNPRAFAAYHSTFALCPIFAQTADGLKPSMYAVFLVLALRPVDIPDRPGPHRDPESGAALDCTLPTPPTPIKRLGGHRSGHCPSGTTFCPADAVPQRYSEGERTTARTEFLVEYESVYDRAALNIYIKTQHDDGL